MVKDGRRGRVAEERRSRMRLMQRASSSSCTSSRASHHTRKGSKTDRNPLNGFSSSCSGASGSRWCCAASSMMHHLQYHHRHHRHQHHLHSHPWSQSIHPLHHHQHHPHLRIPPSIHPFLLLSSADLCINIHQHPKRKEGEKTTRVQSIPHHLSNRQNRPEKNQEWWMREKKNQTNVEQRHHHYLQQRREKGWEGDRKWKRVKKDEEKISISDWSEESGVHLTPDANLITI